MKKFVSLILCWVILSMSVGCKTIPTKTNEEILTANGYIVRYADNKYGYYDALFYNPQSNQYSNILIDDIGKYYKNDIFWGQNSSYINISYKKQGENIILLGVNKMKEPKNSKSFWVPDTDHDDIYFVKRFCNFEYTENGSVDFVDAAHFFLMYNYAMDFKCLNATPYIPSDYIEHHYYKKDEFLSKVKEFFPAFDKSQIENYANLEENYDDEIYFEYDKENDLIYTYDSYSLSGAGYFYFVKSYEKQENGTVKAVVTETDMSNFPIEWTYEYKLNDDGPFI